MKDLKKYKCQQYGSIQTIMAHLLLYNLVFKIMLHTQFQLWCDPLKINNRDLNPWDFTEFPELHRDTISWFPVSLVGFEANDAFYRSDNILGMYFEDLTLKDLRNYVY
jgi:hypothetical protein